MDSGLTILGVETVSRGEGGGREKIRCEVSNSSERFEESFQYLRHLDEVEDSYRKVNTILEDKNDVTPASGDLLGSSCVESAVSANNGNNSKETSLELLEQHKTKCSHQLEQIREKEMSQEGSSPRCGDGCLDCIGPRICSRNHEVSLSDLNCETVLDFLEKKNWQICPYCLTVERENLPFHFVIGHPDIYDIAGNTH